ncbi:MAG TPA: diguanylate cyclase [Magnetospirillaceae bacterium]|jgi:diguanylate cyclase (GGDEF)-like protein/PAS domain S-box-containing protein
MAPRFGLRAYLAAAFAVIVVATGATFAALVGNEVVAALYQRVGLVLVRGGVEALTSIDREIRERQDDMDNYAVIVRHAGALGIADLEWIGVASLSRQERSFGCDWAIATDIDGNVVARTSQDLDAGATVKNRPWFARAKVEATVYGEAATLPDGRPAPRLVLARPLINSLGQPFGVVACDLEPDWSARLVARVTATLPGTDDTEMVVVDAQNRPVSISPSMVDGKLPSKLTELQQVGGPRWQDMDWPDGNNYITAVAHNSGVGPVSELGWQVVVRRLSDIAMQPAVYQRDRIYVVSAIVVFIAAILGAIAAHRILLPLRRIAEAAKRIGSGELGAHIPEFHTYREIETLSRSLHSMLATLRANESRLATMNEGLDHRVRQRTAEIAEAHEELARQESRLRAVIDTATDGVLIIGEENRIQIFNPACERIFGWKAEEIIGRVSTELVGSDNRSLRGNQLTFDDLIGPLATSEIAADQVRTVRGRRRDGTTFPLEVSIARTDIEGGPVYVAIVRDVTESVRARQELFALATKDALTGLRNRRYFLEGAETEFARARRHNRGFSLLLIDADHFKRVNDTYGHAAGDRALQGIAEVCNRSLREVDLIGRLGGEEFAVAMPEADLSVACQVADRLRQQIGENEVGMEDQSLKVTVSIGVASVSATDRTLDQLLRRTDQALYAAKNAGRNCIKASEPVPAEDAT